MLNSQDTRTITAKTMTVLATLRSNLEQHRKIVAEARKGYSEKAMALLQKRLVKFEKGLVADLFFQLESPNDHSKQYKTAIKMLELHDDAGKETIELKAMDVERFVLDEWDWMDQFLLSNSGYSETSQALATAKGLA